MQLLRRSAYFFTRNDLVISSSGGFLTYGIARHFSLEHSSAYAVIVALLTFSVYTLQRIADKPGFANLSNPTLKNITVLSVILSAGSLITAIALGIYCFNSNLLLILLTLLFSFICCWYTIPVFGKKLREIPGIKIIVTALTWVYACAFFPLVNEGIPVDSAGLFSGLLFLYFIAIILPFDIRDVHTDNLSQSTIPQLIGIVSTKLLGTLLLFSFFAGSLLMGIVSFENRVFHAAVAIQVILLLLVSESKTLLYFGLIDLSIVLLGISYLP